MAVTLRAYDPAMFRKRRPLTRKQRRFWSGAFTLEVVLFAWLAYDQLDAHRWAVGSLSVVAAVAFAAAIVLPQPWGLKGSPTAG